VPGKILRYTQDDKQYIMIHLNIITIGKLKEHYWRDAQDEYLKRLSPYVKIEITELKEEKFDDKSNHEVIKEKEAEKIIKAIPENSHIIILDKEGKQFTSEELSLQIDNMAMKQSNNITLVIGGPLGLHESVTKLAKDTWSFSKATFTHQMIRIILLEQIYRAYMIKENRKYHW